MKGAGKGATVKDKKPTSTEFPPPNWTTWKSVFEIELWKAVCLSLNIEPDERLVYAGPVLEPFDFFPPEFHERLFIALSHIGHSFGFWETRIKARSTVHLPEFAAWAVAAKLPGVPPEMAAIAESEPTPSTLETSVRPAQVVTEQVVSDGNAMRTIIHSTKTRRHALKPVIEQAQTQCRNSKDTAEVWAALLVLAEKKTPPLIGATEDGLQYHKDGTVANLSRDALRKRLARLPLLSAANRR